MRWNLKKGKGQTRPLGIPTVVDRLVQQSISQILSPLYEVEFSESSYDGFRPGRSCHDALRKALLVHIQQLDIVTGIE